MNCDAGAVLLFQTKNRRELAKAESRFYFKLAFRMQQAPKNKTLTPGKVFALSNEDWRELVRRTPSERSRIPFLIVFPKRNDGLKMNCDAGTVLLFQPKSGELAAESRHCFKLAATPVTPE